MIDVSKIIVSVANENVGELLNNNCKGAEENDFESEIRNQAMLMKYSTKLLEKYHDALKNELATHGIDI